MDRLKKIFSAEDVLSEITGSYDDELDESEDSDGDMLEECEDDHIITHHQAESSDEDWHPSTSQPAKKRCTLSDLSKSAVSDENRPPKGRQKKSGRKTQSLPDLTSNIPTAKWNVSTDEDITPQPPVFRPFRTPGPQLILSTSYTVLQLFQLFFSTSMLQTIVKNTNAHGASMHRGQKPWQDISLDDLYSYLALVIFMGVVKLPALTDYWRRCDTFGIPFPAKVMSARKFYSISAALHLSDPKVDADNNRKKGTPGYDRLCKIKPMYLEMRDACKNFFHPFQNIAIDERMVATKARNGLKQYMKAKPTKWGYKLFVLADSQCAYTWDFFIYEGKSPAAHIPQNNGLSYESVMSLVDEKMLGTGYKLFVDNFYTSPTLFRALRDKNIWACGTIRSNRVGYPKTTINKLPKKAPRGTHRWLREGNLLFVEWKDTREVQMCSTIHRGTGGGGVVKRKVKGGNGQWQSLDIPVPDCVAEYNRSMGGVDVSDALIGYYTVSHKTRKWYRTFFYHFVDIAIVNAFIIHRQMACMRNQKSLAQKEFREQLVKELFALVYGTVPSPRTSTSNETRHLPGNFASSSTKGRRQCKVCAQKNPVFCKTCLVALCFQPQRDCFNDWHNDH
nr:piggyBac transposable element-derived protein 4-like [Misgurnus anguillicaudatus]